MAGMMRVDAFPWPRASRGRRADAQRTGRAPIELLAEHQAARYVEE